MMPKAALQSHLQVVSDRVLQKILRGMDSVEAILVVVSLHKRAPGIYLLLVPTWLAWQGRLHVLTKKRVTSLEVVTANWIFLKDGELR